MTENAATETAEMDPTKVEAFNTFVERIEALDDDRLNLLGLAALENQDVLLNRLTKANTVEEASHLAGLAGSMMALAGLALGMARDRGDWSSTGDRKVAEIMSDYRDFVTGGALTVLKDADLPRDVIQRMAQGEGTPEDIALIKGILSERTGKDPEDFDMQVTVVGEDGQPVTPEPVAGASSYVAPKRDTLYL